MRLTLKILAALLLAAFLLSGGAGWMMAAGALHPARKPLTHEQIAAADRVFESARATREDFTVSAPDRAALRGWKVRATNPNGDWVVLFHGVADNRAGVLGQAAFLLRAGYSVAMMDARAHGESGGAMATYGWLERNDTRVIVDALESAEHPHCVFALGESMGGAIALQAAAVTPQIDAVVAESSFSSLHEVLFDYAGLQFSPLLGKTLFRPAAIFGGWQIEREGKFKTKDVSPERAVAARAFPVLLICDGRDRTIPCRHTQAIYRAAIGPKQLWIVPGAAHASAYGAAPAEFERRVLEFFAGVHAKK